MALISALTALSQTMSLATGLKVFVVIKRSEQITPRLSPLHIKLFTSQCLDKGCRAFSNPSNMSIRKCIRRPKSVAENCETPYPGQRSDLDRLWLTPALEPGRIVSFPHHIGRVCSERHQNPSTPRSGLHVASSQWPSRVICRQKLPSMCTREEHLPAWRPASPKPALVRARLSRKLVPGPPSHTSQGHQQSSLQKMSNCITRTAKAQVLKRLGWLNIPATQTYLRACRSRWVPGLKTRTRI